MIRKLTPKERHLDTSQDSHLGEHELSFHCSFAFSFYSVVDNGVRIPRSGDAAMLCGSPVHAATNTKK